MSEGGYGDVLGTGDDIALSLAYCSETIGAFVFYAAYKKVEQVIDKLTLYVGTQLVGLAVPETLEEGALFLTCLNPRTETGTLG